jgi:hypothetical protein
VSRPAGRDTDSSRAMSRWDRPLGLAFTCLLAAVPRSLVAAPFTMVLLAAFLTQVGALQIAPC